jgi:myo-inositol 2-dehydrogenase / D-chiro-inositol 1-dehydrogenase
MTLNIGIVGTGWFGAKHARLLASMKDVRVSAICGSTLDKAEELARDFPHAQGYSSIHTMLDRCKLDAVYICVPPFAHGEIELAVAERGIPFFVEKPLGVDLQAPSSILEAVRQHRTLTSVGYHFRYLDSTTMARILLQDRTVGMAIGYWMGSMPGVYWWRQQTLSGGQIVEQTTHIIDLLRYLLGEVTEVYAACSQRVMHTKEDQVSVPDVGTMSLKLASGAVASISNASMLPAGHYAGLNIYTDAGLLELNREGLKDVQASQTTNYLNHLDPYETETRAFLHAVRTGDSSGILSSYEDAWRSQQVAVALNQSAATGLPVKLPSQ